MKSIFASILFALISLTLWADEKKQSEERTKSQIQEEKMKVEIWGDIICPFCYIGNKEFKLVLEKFQYRDQIEVTWKSYQISPDMKTVVGKSIFQVIAEKQDGDIEQIKERHMAIAQRIRAAGLEVKFETVVPANSFKAHQLTQLAKRYGKSNEAYDQLFKSYFVEGKNIDDIPTLVQVGKSLGLSEDIVRKGLENNSYEKEVRDDREEGQRIGVQGVPFFVFNRKYAAAGSQGVDGLLEALNEAYAEWKKENPMSSNLKISEGQSCALDSKNDKKTCE